MSKRKKPIEYADSDSDTDPIQIFELDASLTLATRVPSYLKSISVPNSGSGKILSCKSTLSSTQTSPPASTQTATTSDTLSSAICMSPSIPSMFTSTPSPSVVPDLILSGEDALSEMWSESLSENTKKEYQVLIYHFLLTCSR